MAHAQIMKTKHTDKHSSLRASGAFPRAVQTLDRATEGRKAEFLLHHGGDCMASGAGQSRAVEAVAGDTGHLGRQEVKRAPAETQS